MRLTNARVRLAVAVILMDVFAPCEAIDRKKWLKMLNAARSFAGVSSDLVAVSCGCAEYCRNVVPENK